jgi:peptidoglycan/xylan/chitin deacetylase (PgdA/CDA1 family)
MQRRSLLIGLAVGGLSAAGGWAGAPDGLASGLAADPAPTPWLPSEPVEGAVADVTRVSAPDPASTPSPGAGSHPHPSHHGAAPPRIIDHLPGLGAGHARDVALTIDDGTDTDVVKAFLDFAQRTGIKLTFFPNGVYRSWTDHQAQLRRLLEAGQVQVGNHTWSHPDLTKLSDRDVFTQIDRNDKFLTRLLGVSPRPWFRPPYGAHDQRVDRIAADLGYDRITLWDGTFGDFVLLTPAQLMAQAQLWMTPKRIVIGHANHPAVTHCYPQLAKLVSDRKLTPRTLAEAFAHE